MPERNNKATSKQISFFGEWFGLKIYRHPKGVFTPINLCLVSIRNPNLAMWWAAAFPGFPQIAMCRFFTGFILVTWEFFVNEKAHLNLSILYTFIGEFELARQVLDSRWAIIYIPVYIYGIWDSRRIVMDVNKHAILADNTGSARDLPPAIVGWFESNFMIKRKPGVAAFWSCILPGLGHLYLHRISTAFFLMAWVIIILYFSNLTLALQLTVFGQFNVGTSMLNPQWLLYYPSLLGFSIFDSYSFCERANKLLQSQQAYYFEECGQPPAIQTNLLSKRVNIMNVVASFADSMYVELAVSELKQNGIQHEDIFVIPLNETQPKKNIDLISGKEGLNLFECTAATATGFSVLGVIYGSIWTWGPVVWGLIGLFVGALLGFLLDFLVDRRKLIKAWKKGKGGELMVIIHCSVEQVQTVKTILFDHFTLGVSVIEFNKATKIINSDNFPNDC